MIKIVNKTKYILEVGQIDKMEGDVLFVWTTQNLNSGDATFIRIHKEAGSIIYEQCMNAAMKYGEADENQQKVIPVGQAIITDSGKLEFYNMIHCVLPNKRIKEQFNKRTLLLTNVVYLGAELADAYGDASYKLHSAFFSPIPPVIYGEVNKDDIKLFFTTLFKISKFKKIHIIFETEEEYKKYVKVFTSLTQTFYEKWINKLFRFKF